MRKEKWKEQETQTEQKRSNTKEWGAGTDNEQKICTTKVDLKNVHTQAKKATTIK